MSAPPTTWSHSTTSTSSSNMSSSTAPSLQPTTRGIDLGGWSVRVTSGPIGSSAEMDALSEILGIPPPEMAFPHNSLVLQHADSGFSLCFDAVRTLRSVQGVRSANRLYGIDCRESPSSSKGGSGLGAKPKARATGGGSIKVAYAKEWGKSRNEFVSPNSSNPTGERKEQRSHFGNNDITAAKDYDWTYSTTFPGSLNSTSPQPLLATQTTPTLAAGLKPLSPPLSPIEGGREWFESASDPARDRIPVERLGPSSGEPILFYDDIVLYEDELADNGSSIVNVKVRVMPSGFLVLQRFFLRVDDVLFRVFDTRLYCAFPPPPVPKHIATGHPSPSTLPTSLDQLSLGSPRNHSRSSDSHITMTDTDREAEEPFTPRLIRECSGSESSYSLVKSHLPPYKPHDLSPLTDINWVYNTLVKIERTKSSAYHAQVAQGAQLPRLGDKDANTGAKYLSPSEMNTRITTGMGIERVDLSPATLPTSGEAAEGARIVGELQTEDVEASEWIGCGGRIDVAILKLRS